MLGSPLEVADAARCASELQKMRRDIAALIEAQSRVEAALLGLSGGQAGRGPGTAENAGAGRLAASPAGTLAMRPTSNEAAYPEGRLVQRPRLSSPDGARRWSAFPDLDSPRMQRRLTSDMDCRPTLDSLQCLASVDQQGQQRQQRGGAGRPEGVGRWSVAEDRDGPRMQRLLTGDTDRRPTLESFRRLSSVDPAAERRQDQQQQQRGCSEPLSSADGVGRWATLDAGRPASPRQVAGPHRESSFLPSYGVGHMLLQPRKLYDPGARKMHTGLAKGSNSAIQCQATSVYESSRWHNWAAVHPSSRLRLLVDVCICLVLTYDSLTVPFALAWAVPNQGVSFFIGCGTTVFWLLEMVLNVFTGFRRGEKLVMHLGDTARFYLSTYFLPDLAILLCDIVGVALTLQYSTADDVPTQTLLTRLGRLAKMSRLFRIAAMLRTGRLFSAVEKLLEEGYRRAPVAFHPLWVHIGKACFMIIWPSHFICCAWYATLTLGDADTGSSWRDTLDAQGAGSWTRHFMYSYGFQWSLSTMLSYSSFMPPSNTSECVLVCAVLLFGFMSCTAIVSNFAARFMDYQLQNHERREKLQALERFLRQHEVDSLLAIAIRHQVEERMSQAARQAYENVQVLGYLSTALRSELHYSLNSRHLLRHDMLRAFGDLDDQLIGHLCAHVVTRFSVSPGTLVFADGEEATCMYIVAWGALEYALTSEWAVAHHGERQREDVVADSHICEIVLWAKWRTLGVLEVAAPTELLRVDVDAFAFAVTAGRHGLVGLLASEFAERLCGAIREDAPTVFTDLHIAVDRDVVCSTMSVYTRSIMSWPLINLLERSRVGTASYKSLEDLELEVVDGFCHLRRGEGNTILRIVPLTAVRLQRPDGAVLVEVGVRRGATVNATFKLPGTKFKEGETLDDTRRRLLRLMSLEPHSVSFLSQEVTTEQRPSEAFGVDTKYVRRTCVGTTASSPSGARARCRPLPPSVRLQVGDLPFQDAFFVTSPSGNKVGIYAWLHEDEFEQWASAGMEARLAVAAVLRDLEDEADLYMDMESSAGSSQRADVSDGNTMRKLASWLPKALRGGSSTRTTTRSTHRTSGRRSTALYEACVAGSVASTGMGDLGGGPTAYVVIWASGDRLQTAHAVTLVAARRIFASLPRFQSRAMYGPDGTMVASWFFSEHWASRIEGCYQNLARSHGDNYVADLRSI